MGRRAFLFLEVMDLDIRDEASRIHDCGFNCAQSVLCSCGKYTGLDESLAAAIGAGFGGGVRSGEICGAIAGAVMALGLISANDASGEKRSISALSRECVDSFRREYGCVRCLELKKAGVSCDELIRKGAQFVEAVAINK